MHDHFFRKRCVTILASIVIGGLAMAPACSSEIVWSPALELSTLSELDTRISKAFDESITLVFQEKTSDVTNCLGLLALRARGYEPLGDQAHAAERYEGARCLALTALRNARAARTSNLIGLTLNPAALRILPPSLSTAFSTIEEEMARKAEANGKSWSRYEPRVRARMEQQVMVVSNKVWQSGIEIFARADFDGDGTEDLLVGVDETATAGTLNNTRLFLLTRSSPRTMIRTTRRLQ